MSSQKIQTGRGEAHTAEVKAMPNEALIIHQPSPETNRILKVNDINESRYAKVIAVGEATGRYAKVGAPIKEGELVLTRTAFSGVAVPGLFAENKQLHRLAWTEILGVVENEEQANG